MVFLSLGLVAILAALPLAHHFLWRGPRLAANLDWKSPATFKIPVSELAFAAKNGAVLVRRGAVEVVSAASGEVVGSHASRPNSGFTPDGRYEVVLDQGQSTGTMVFASKTGKLIKTVPLQLNIPPNSPGNFRRQLLRDRAIRLADPATGQVLRRIALPDSTKTYWPVRASLVYLSPNRAVVRDEGARRWRDDARKDENVMVFDLDNGKMINGTWCESWFGEPRSMGYTPNGQIIMDIRDLETKQGLLRLLDESGQVWRSFNQRPGENTSTSIDLHFCFPLCVSRDQKYLLGLDRSSRFIRPEDQGEKKVTLWDVKTQQVLWNYRKEGEWVDLISLSPNGKMVACGGFKPVANGTFIGHLRILESATGKEILEFSEVTASAHLSKLGCV